MAGPPGDSRPILFVTRKWPPAVGGMELYSRELADAYRHLGPTGVLALPGRADGRPPHLLRLLGFMVTTAAALAWRGRRYRLIHFGDLVLFPLCVWARLWAPGTRRIVTVHGLDLLYGRRRGALPRLYRGYLAMTRALQGSADAFVANSSSTRQVAEAAGFRRVRAVPLAIALAGDDPQPADLAMADPPFVLFVGRLVPRKGAAWFASSVLPLLSEEVTFVVVGAAWDAGEAAGLAAAPRCRHLGRLPDAEVAALRRSAVAVVLPNQPGGAADIEGFGLAALEAAAAGIVVASRLEGLIDAVADGETGFLEDPGDPGAWARRLQDLLDWPAERRAAFVAASRAVLRERYAWDRVARDTLAAGEPTEGQRP
ncbi:MAG: glycosyltransferase family 4 protein [Rhodospirillaceae bacterium]|nr:glycosyltransferase family 4 protein [Rhodospirillaceae bacterium]